MNVMEDETYIDLIAKYLSGNITPTEKQELMAWVETSEANRAFFEESLQLWGISDNYVEEPFEADLNVAWTTMYKKLPKEEVQFETKEISTTKKTAKVFSLAPLLRVAVAACLILGAGYWWYAQEEEPTPTFVAINTGEDERKEVALPDGSTVWLNENTTLTYDSIFSNRFVQLEGEAFFDVARQETNPFRIESGETVTTVLGTKFNVRAYPEEKDVEVTVESGKVAFNKEAEQQKKAVILNKGNSGIYSKKEKEVRKVEKQIVNANAWKTRSLGFESDKYSEVIPSLERFYDIEIEVKNEAILNCVFTFGREANPNLEKIIETIDWQTSSSLMLEKKDEKYYELKGNCN